MPTVNASSGHVSNAPHSGDAGASREPWLEIIPPAQAIVPGSTGPAATRLIAFPTASIPDAEAALVVAPDAITARPLVERAPRSAIAVRIEHRTRSLGGSSLLLNGLLTVALGLGVALLSGRQSASDVVAAPHHIEHASRVPTAADWSDLTFAMAWLELRRTNALVRPEPAARVEAASLAARAEVAPVIEVTPAMLDLNAPLAVPAAAVSTWTTTTAAAPIAAPARSGTAKSAKSTARQNIGTKGTAKPTRTAATGAALPRTAENIIVAASTRPGSPPRHWSGSAFESRR